MNPNHDAVLQQLQNAIEDVQAEISRYVKGGKSNAAAARRIRKHTLDIAKIGKDFRKLSVEHHSK